MTIETRGAQEPHFLIVPGLNDSGPTHWQSHWLGLLRYAHKAELGDWGNPTRDRWVARLDAAIRSIDAPVILVAHSLGCHAVAHWAAIFGNAHHSNVSGALLVAPPDCDREDAHPLVRQFGPSAHVQLAFPAILAASRNDEYATLDFSRRVARRWHSDFVDIGELGHINAASGIGHWPAGLALLGRTIVRAGFGREERAARLERAWAPAPESIRAAA